VSDQAAADRRSRIGTTQQQLVPDVCNAAECVHPSLACAATFLATLHVLHNAPSSTNVIGHGLLCLERLKDGNIHMCFFSRSAYRPLINPLQSLGNLLLDITLCSISFRRRFVFCVLILGLGSVIG